jgi:nucleoporin POM152
MGDALYPLAVTNAAFKTSKSISELSFRQEVLPRPRAYFKTTDHLTYCLHDKFRAEDLGAHSGVIQLLGRSPFYLDLSLHNLATGETKRDRIQLLQNEWRVELPDYRFETVGSYMLVIDSVKDASSCEQEENVLGTNSLFIDVAESAAIVPFERREEYCVGEILRFQLEG